MLFFGEQRHLILVYYRKMPKFATDDPTANISQRQNVSAKAQMYYQPSALHHPRTYRGNFLPDTCA